ncbi:phospholipase D family protein [Micromonospora sp. S4605]|uniref:phospholipase D family protein n=1 Tax=Micromonospora sp. S4605 TaxID=1420897 RepID=UPI0011B53CBE|nr:phospholipase D family protein [Micromonospora sp. S4605]
MLTTIIGRPGDGVDLKQYLLGALVSHAGGRACVRAGFAYVTRSGATDLIGAMELSPQWRGARKRWLVGVHHAISEPAAIDALAALPNSQVRLAVCGESIRAAIIGRSIFHAKVVAVGFSGTSKISSIFAGSANLTSSAMGTSARNYEAGLFWGAKVPKSEAQTFNQWWDMAWSQALRATSANLDTYISERERFLRSNPDIILGTIAAAPEAVASARMLWIEAGEMSGGARNQIEFGEELAAFFGPLSPAQRLITILRGGRAWNDRPLTPKRTTFGVRIWRLSLPTLAQSGLQYPQRTICFQKGDLEGVYQLEVADSDSELAKSWRESTHRRGVVARTGGGRSYGFA